MATTNTHTHILNCINCLIINVIFSDVSTFSSFFCLILSRKLLSFITVVLTLSPFKLHLSRICQTVRWQLPHLSSHSAAPSTEVPAEYTPATAHHLSPVAEPRQQRQQQQCPPKQSGGDQS